MAGAAPPDHLKKYFKQDGDQWVYDDSYSKVADQLKADDTPTAGDYASTAGGKLFENVGNTMVTLGGGTPMEAYKPDPASKAKFEQAYGKPLTDAQALKLGVPAASGPVSETAAAAAAGPAGAPPPAPPAPAPAAQPVNPMAYDGTQAWTAPPGAMVDAKGNPSTAHAVPSAVVQKKSATAVGGDFRPVEAQVAPSAYDQAFANKVMFQQGGGGFGPKASIDQPLNTATAADVQGAKGEWWAQGNPGLTAPAQQKVAPGSSAAASMMRAPEEFGQPPTPKSPMPPWFGTPASAPAAAPGSTFAPGVATGPVAAPAPAMAPVKAAPMAPVPMAPVAKGALPPPVAGDTAYAPKMTYTPPPVAPKVVAAPMAPVVVPASMVADAAALPDGSRPLVGWDGAAPKKSYFKKGDKELAGLDAMSKEADSLDKKQPKKPVKAAK